MKMEIRRKKTENTAKTFETHINIEEGFVENLK